MCTWCRSAIFCISFDFNNTLEVYVNNEIIIFMPVNWEAISGTGNVFCAFWVTSNAQFERCNGGVSSIQKWCECALFSLCLRSVDLTSVEWRVLQQDFAPCWRKKKRKSLTSTKVRFPNWKIRYSSSHNHLPFLHSIRLHSAKISVFAPVPFALLKFNTKRMEYFRPILLCREDFRFSLLPSYGPKLPGT